MSTPPLTRFLLRSMEPGLRKRLEKDAKRSKQPLIEVVRSILCEHYDLECTPITGDRTPWQRQWEGSSTILLKLQPELFEAIKRDSEESGESMRVCVLGALEAHYAKAVT